jgi:murein DD-endopeptidase MepM/ murein hydrolase activator NlpD
MPEASMSAIKVGPHAQHVWARGVRLALLAPAAAICLASTGVANAESQPPDPGSVAGSSGPAGTIASAALIAAEHAAFMDERPNTEIRPVKIAPGDTVFDALRRAGAADAEASASVAAMLRVAANPRLAEGRTVTAYFERPRDTPAVVRLAGFSLRTDFDRTVSVGRTSDGGYRATELVTASVFEVAARRAVIEEDLLTTARKLGATEREVEQIEAAFAFDIDFQRDVGPGAVVELVFERYRDDWGETLKTGELLFASLQPRGGPAKSFYRFIDPQTNEAGFYDENGVTARKDLMRTPIKGSARLSSDFGMRRHPVLGFSKMHKGIDFAAPAGTPVLAAGDAVVVQAGWFSTYGNYVRLDHGGGLETAYAHLSRYARGLKVGDRVAQGDVIAYVGSTGRSTGAHLHYEIMVNGVQVNPLSIQAGHRAPLQGGALSAFMADRARIDALRVKDDAQRPAGEPPAVVSDASEVPATRQVSAVIALPLNGLLLAGESFATALR